MKYLIILLALTGAISASAATVRVTSFSYINQKDRLAELCGKVDGATSEPSFIRAVIDPRTKNPGAYNTLAAADGNFCLTVVTYSGLAEVSLFGETQASPASIK